MLEVPYQLDLLLPFNQGAVHPRVQDAHGHVVDPRVGTVEHEEAVGHDPEAHVRLGEAFVAKLVFEEGHVPIVQDRVVIAKFIERDLVLRVGYQRGLQML